jgi:hypothetical protein
MSKAQFYIITAVIFCVILFVLIYTKGVVGSTDTSFKNVYDNYIYESPNVINSAFYENRNITEEFENYTLSFINYAKTKNINLKIFYIINTKSSTYIGNHLGETINLTDLIISKDDCLTIERINNLSLSYENQTYNYDLSSDENILFKALLIKE